MPSNLLFNLIAPIVGLWGFSLFGLTDVSRADATKIVTCKLQWSSVHFVDAGESLLLIDAGSPGEANAIMACATSHQLALSKLRLIILTHGHADHAGSAAALRAQFKTPIMMGKGDDWMALGGHIDEIRPTNLLAKILKHLVPTKYEPFTPDILVEQPADLRPYGFGGAAHPMAGHTSGTLAVTLDSGDSFGGDMILGGIWGGVLFSSHPGPHYFHADIEENLKSIRALLALGPRQIFLGHGGPVTASATREAFDIHD